MRKNEQQQKISQLKSIQVNAQKQEHIEWVHMINIDVINYVSVCVLFYTQRAQCHLLYAQF